MKKNSNLEIDYGVLSDVSKDLNCNVFGDCGGSTISRRTTKGFKKAFNMSNENISDQDAEHIIHAAMVGTAACLTSKNEKTTFGGFLMLAGLIFFYQNGK